MYVVREGIGEGKERGKRRRFISWAFRRKLGENHTPVMEKFRQHITSTFYIRFSYSYIIGNVKIALKTVYYKMQNGSPWINTFAVSERWLHEQESKQSRGKTLIGCL